MQKKLFNLVSQEFMIFNFLVYNNVEMAINKKLICNVEVQCTTTLQPENQIWNFLFNFVLYFYFFFYKLNFFRCFMLFIGSLMIFGTCYDLYVVRALDLEAEILKQNQRRQTIALENLENFEKIPKPLSSFDLQPQGKFILKVFNFF